MIVQNLDVDQKTHWIGFWSISNTLCFLDFQFIKKSWKKFHSSLKNIIIYNVLGAPN